ncbi:MAG TPA: SAM-dependent methyltransferase [Treponema sp.]|nr:SAM-dependent methyltransferase [Treponema sp.]
MGNRKKKNSGPDAFEAYYSNLFGARWGTLKKALLEPSQQIGWEEELLEPYYLDSASVAAARALPTGGINILDLCAAPGGKSLVLASTVGDAGTITANEYSRDRRARLVSVLERYVPEPLRSRYSVTGNDGSRWSRYEKSTRDRILLDVPCSSERHVLSSPAHLEKWSAARIRNLSFRQWALLSGAWLVLSPGGYLLYATCALSPEENDGVIQKLVKKYSDVELVGIAKDKHPALVHHVPEKTEYGTIILPDTSAGSGPLYFSLVRKMEA